MNPLVKMLPNVITSKAARQLLKGRKNSPHIMFGAGVVGIVATVVVASKATLQLEVVLENRKDNLEKANRLHAEGRADYSDQDYSKDIITIQTKNVIALSKLYGPAVGIGIISIGLLTGSHIVLTQRNAGLAAAYALLDKGFKEYRERVESEYGPDAEKHIRYDVREETLTQKGTTNQVKVLRPGAGNPSVYARFFDELNPNWAKTPEYNLIFLQCQQNYANDMLRARGHIFLNEVYDMLKMERSRAGAVVGWVLNHDGDNYVDFGIFDGNNAKARDFVNGREGAILLDFNVDGVVYDKI